MIFSRAQDPSFEVCYAKIEEVWYAKIEEVKLVCEMSLFQAGTRCITVEHLKCNRWHTHTEIIFTAKPRAGH